MPRDMAWELENMTRPAIPVCSGLVFGMAAAYYLFADGGGGLRELIAALLIFAAAALLACLFKTSFYARAVVFSIAAAAGIFYSFVYTNLHMRPIQALAGSQIEIDGTVFSRSVKDSGQAIIYGKINGISGGVTVYSAENLGEPGDHVILRGAAYPIENDGFYDNKTRFFPDGIFISANVGEICETGRNGGIFGILRRFSEYVSKEIRARLPGSYGELLSAMTTGDRSVMSDRLSLSLNRSGAGHIAAVSGLHVTVAVFFLRYILGRLRAPRAAASLTSLAFAGLFTVFTGLRISAIRAAVMMSIFIVGEIILRRQDALNTLCVSAALICLFSPFSVGDISFQLSFAGAAAMAISPEIIKNIKNINIGTKLLKTAAVSLSASLFTAPFVLLHFNEISLAAPIVNIFVIPLCTVSVVFGILFAMTGCVFPWLLAPAFVAEIPVIAICGAVSKLRFAYLPVSRPEFAAIGFLIAILVACAYYFLRRPGLIFKLSVMAASVCIFIYGLAFTLNRNEVTVTVANLSRGRGIILQKASECLIIDIGGGLSDLCEEFSEKNGCVPSAVIAIDGGPSASSAYSRLPCAPENIYITSPGQLCTVDAGWARAEIADSTVKIFANGAELRVYSDFCPPDGAKGGSVVLLDGLTIAAGKTYGRGMTRLEIGSETEGLR